MGSRTRQRRRQLDRAGIAERTGMSTATVDRWYRHRTRTGFPDKADTGLDGRDWWWQADIDAFHTVHLAARASAFTRVDRSGDPRDLLTAPQAAQVLGYKNHRSLPDDLIDNPDHVEHLPSGRRRRYWHRRTVWTYVDGRPLRHSSGRPAGTTIGSRASHPYADDPRLDTALALINVDGDRAGLGTQLAHYLNISERTGQRLIAAALESLRSDDDGQRQPKRRRDLHESW
jgi:predicted DNA-binding transcriptional regulator AlpA